LSATLCPPFSPACCSSCSSACTWDSSSSSTARPSDVRAGRDGRKRPRPPLWRVSLRAVYRLLQ
jgi:hypothetical protein